MKFSNMDKNSIVIVLLVLQIMVTFTSTAHHEAKDLGAAAANFFEVTNTPVSPNVLQMPEPDDPEHSKEETGGDIVDVNMDKEDTHGEDPFVDVHNLFEEDIQVINDETKMDNLAPKFKQTVNMALEMKQMNNKALETKQMNMAPQIKHMDMASKKSQDPTIQKMHAQLMNEEYTYYNIHEEIIMAPKMKYMDNMASTKSQYPTLQKMHAQISSQYPTYETTSTYGPQAYDSYDTPTYRQGYKEYQTNQVHYVPVIHVQRKNVYKHSHDQYNNQYPVRYVPEVLVQRKNDYKRSSHGRYNPYVKKHLGTQSKYYQGLRW